MTAPILLIDIGNTRIKWHMQTAHTAMSATNEPNSLSHHNADWLQHFTAKMSQSAAPSACYISNVASTELLNTVKNALHAIFPNIQIHNVLPQKQLGRFTLAYDEPLQMGSDRFAQLLGAQNLCAERDHLVISTGTATTVDGVLANGQHMGGMIAPSIHLMRTSLHQHTARLPLDGGVFATQTAPTNTTNALATGAHLSRIGAIIAFVDHYMPHTTQHWLICGGDAPNLALDLKHIAAQRNATLHIAPSLCLLGLWCVHQFRSQP
ncbi:type III pantothenate kinase [Hydromonas duriensis]|uniref:Type III pantothenate kinase n=1 Tax=Hydromonas duriensis TaxID=1527608 RepID=A0A4R6Y4R8_9BURK|nr:type III pantothenate kinase [Hydromonas duriensis]TDR30198.1 type III pantothenate kinase [Hydromonas duriensis]